MIVFPDRQGEAAGVAAGHGIETVGTLHDIPAIVPAGSDEVNFLVGLLSNIGQPELSGH